MASDQDSMLLLNVQQNATKENDTVSRNYNTILNGNTIASDDANTVSRGPGDLKNNASLTTNTVTFIHLLKSNIGTGIHSIPYAFKKAGLAGGFVAVSLLGIMCVHCMLILVKCSRILCFRANTPCLDYASVTEVCFETGPGMLRRYSKFSRYFVQTFLIVTQVGICCIFIVYCSKNIEQILETIFPSDTLPVQIYWAVLLLLLVPLSCIRDLNRLALLSNFANILTALGLVLIFRYLLTDLPHTNERPLFSSWSQIPILFGSAIYTFEGIGVVLPLENKMRTPAAFGGWNGVLGTGMAIVVCLNLAVGFFGYLRYGDDVKGSVTLNLPSGDSLVYVIQASLAAGVMLGYSIQFYVPVHIIWPTLQSSIKNESRHRCCEYGLRLIIMMFTYVFARFVPHLGLFISLIGSIGSSFLALVFPSLIETLVLWPNKLGNCYWVLWKNITISLIGIVGAIIGTYLSFKELISFSD